MKRLTREVLKEVEEWVREQRINDINDLDIIEDLKSRLRRIIQNG